MKKTLLASIVGALFGSPVVARAVKTRDSGEMAFLYRMGSGFQGDVNRTHPVSIEPTQIDPDHPPLFYGCGVILNGSGEIRPLAAGDTGVTTLWGVTSRPFPTQQTSGNLSVPFGSATPPDEGVQDVVRSGYITINLPAPTGAAKKGGPVFMWIAASSGDHVQGGFEDAATGGSTIALDTELYTFNNVADANGNVELCCNV